MRYLVKDYRILLILYGIGGLAAMWEVTSPTPEQDRIPVYYTETMLELYPEAPEQLYYRAMQAMYGRGDLVEARSLFEQALATGDKMNEQLLHAYAVDLVLLNVNSEEIDRAVTKWKRNFPQSTLPDPRDFTGTTITPNRIQSIPAARDR